MSALITRASISSVAPGRVAIRAPASVAALRAAVCESDCTVGASTTSAAAIAAATDAGGSAACEARSAIRHITPSAPTRPASPRSRSPSPIVAGLQTTTTSSPSRTPRHSRTTALTARSRSLIRWTLPARARPHPRHWAGVRLAPMQSVAEGVWRIAKGFPLSVNAFLVADGDGVAVFDAGMRSMGRAIREAAETLGGPTRTILGNAHADHRGGAKEIGAPAQCHADERADVEGDGGAHYFDYSKLAFPTNLLTPRMMGSWDCGPLEVSATLAEGDAVGEFSVVHLPGHGPGCIGLWRERDRSRSATTASRSSTRRSPARAGPGSPIPRSTGRPSGRGSRSASSLRSSPPPAGPDTGGPLSGDVRAQLEAI